MARAKIASGHGRVEGVGHRSGEVAQREEPSEPVQPLGHAGGDGERVGDEGERDEEPVGQRLHSGGAPDHRRDGQTERREGRDADDDASPRRPAAPSRDQLHVVEREADSEDARGRAEDGQGRREELREGHITSALDDGAAEQARDDDEEDGRQSDREEGGHRVAEEGAQIVCRQKGQRTRLLAALGRAGGPAGGAGRQLIHEGFAEVVVALDRERVGAAIGTLDRPAPPVDRSDAPPRQVEAPGSSPRR